MLMSTVFWNVITLLMNDSSLKIFSVIIDELYNALWTRKKKTLTEASNRFIPLHNKHHRWCHRNFPFTSVRACLSLLIKNSRAQNMREFMEIKNQSRARKQGKEKAWFVLDIEKIKKFKGILLKVMRDFWFQKRASMISEHFFKFIRVYYFFEVKVETTKFAVKSSTQS